MLNLPSSLITAKNAWDSDEPTLIVVKVDIPDVLAIPMRVVANDVDINWKDPDDGVAYDWIAFPFEIDDLGEPGKGEMPNLVLRVSNIGRAVQGYVDQADGGIDGQVTIHAINGGNLAIEETYVTMTFTVGGTSCDEQWVTFKLTSMDPFRRKFPKNRHLKNYCSYKFKDVFCAYSGPEGECNHTLTRCKELGNDDRFGGFPSVGLDGLKVTSSNMFTA